MNTLLWVGFPYLAMILFFVVPVIRMAYRPFGITTRASSMFNRQVLGIASMLLHWGIILLFVGHLVGFLGGLRGSDLAISWFYYLGLAGGVMAISGSAIALIRRFTVPEVRALSLVDDYLVHVFLILVIGLGIGIAVALTASDNSSQAPALADIDPYTNPEVFGVTQTVAATLSAPALADIDPHTNPEVF